MRARVGKIIDEDIIQRGGVYKGRNKITHTERGKEQAQTKTERGRRSERSPQRGRKEKVKI